jgi:transposase
MSLKPQPISPIPEDTARLVRTVLPRGNTITLVRDEFDSIYTDADFTALFSNRGQPAFSPWRLAVTTILQFIEGLTDRQAAEAVKVRMDWKYTLALELTDTGFDYSILSEFRSRLITSQAEQLLFDKLLERLKIKGFIKPKGKQRTDSTHVLAVVRHLNHLELVAETLRAALNALAVADSDWLRRVTPNEWFERYSHRIEEYRLPKSKEKRTEYARSIGKDGQHLLTLLDANSTLESLRALPSVQTLRLIWSQHFKRSRTSLKLLDGKELPKGATRPCSPYEIEARCSNKRNTTWVGYKVHLTETCDEGCMRLITHVQTTLATLQDVSCTASTQEALTKKGLTPAVHLVDAGYIDADLLVTSAGRGIKLLGPVRLNSSWQTKVKGAFELSQFRIDWDAQQVICPEGKVSSGWYVVKDRCDREAITVKFRRSDCATCPMRMCCTRAKLEPRMLKLHPREAHQALVAAKNRELGEEYNLRAGVEGTISQGTRSFGLRQSRYRGLARTRLQHLAGVVAMDISRVADWLEGRPRLKPYVSKFGALKS